MSTCKTQLGIATIVTLVALRLTIGWHFYKEGMKKYQDPGFSSAPFLMQAKGPLAEKYHDMAGGDFHGWDELMARPVEGVEPSEEQLAELAAWEKSQRDKAKKAEADGKPVEIEIAPNAAYKDWADRVIGDWRQLLQEHIDRCNFSEEQKHTAGEIFLKRKAQLIDYLEENSGEIVDFQHELYRLQKLEESQTSGSLPYHDQRSAIKRAEALGMSGGWKSSVKTFEQGFISDLWGLLEDEQKSQADLVMGPSELETVDKVVTYLTLGVGVCLVLGLFTRLASLAGALFLLSVIATQPPWVAGAAPVYYQSVEMVALLMLATTHVGKWGGLDFFISSLLGGCCRPSQGETS